MHYTNLNFPADQTQPKAVGQRERYIICHVLLTVQHYMQPTHRVWSIETLSMNIGKIYSSEMTPTILYLMVC